MRGKAHHVFGLVVLIAATGAQASGDETVVSKHFEAGGPRIGSSVLVIAAPDDATEDGSLDIGGVTFDAIGGTGLREVQVKVRYDARVPLPDRVSPVRRAPRFTLCQDRNANGICALEDGDRVPHAWESTRRWVSYRVEAALPISIAVDAGPAVGGHPWVPTSYRVYTSSVSGVVWLRQDSGERARR